MKPQSDEVWTLTADERNALDRAQKMLGHVPEWYWKHKNAVNEVRKVQKEEEAEFLQALEALIVRMKNSCQGGPLHARQDSGTPPS